MYFTSGAIARSNAYFHQGSESILLNVVHCTGDEISIFSCNHNGIGSHICDNNEDAGVVCLEGEYINSFLVFISR